MSLNPLALYTGINDQDDQRAHRRFGDRHLLLTTPVLNAFNTLDYHRRLAPFSLSSNDTHTKDKEMDVFSAVDQVPIAIIQVP